MHVYQNWRVKMPRKKPEELKSAAPAAAPTPAAAPSPAPAAPVIQQSAPAPQPVSEYHPADINGDGKVDAEEKAMELEFRRKALEDADAMRDAQRKMAWFALFGMLLYPFAVVLAVFANLEQAGDILGSMAATYFVSVAAIVAAFFGGQAYAGKSATAKKR
jgi:hypothetical protein